MEAPDANVSTACFRIFQELLTNVARHANAHSVEVILAEDGGDLLLDVSDDGVGINKSGRRASTSLGLLGMRERAEFLSGSVVIDASSNGGTRAIVRIPMRQA